MALKSVTRLGTLVAGASMVALLAAACGSDDSSDGGGDGGNAAAPPGNDAVVSVQSSNVGDVLTASSGKAMYTSEQEADGTVLCVDSCTTFWEPVMIEGDAPTVEGVSGTLGTVERPDGGTQLTLDGAPLYTFSSDRPGTVTADDLPDSFGDQSFVWHVATADGSDPAGGGSIPTYSY